MAPLAAPCSYAYELYIMHMKRSLQSSLSPAPSSSPPYVDSRDVRNIGQHALIAQEPERQIFGVIANRHRGNDFLRI